MCKVSVIVPIYNTAKYLKRCICSIIEQELKDIEIICVNDGSTDNSLDILQELAVQDSRIRIVNQCNAGSVSARKSGVAIANGEYIGFVDSDDWIDYQMYKQLYQIAVENNADLITSGYIQEGNYISSDYDSLEEGLYQGNNIEELYNRMILDRVNFGKGVSGSLCTKIIRSNIIKSCISEIQEDIYMSEDKIMVINCILNSNAVYVLHKAYYHYIMRNNSVTHISHTNYLNNVNLVYEHFISLYRHPNFTDSMRIQCELYITMLLIKGINSRMGFSIKNLIWIDPYWLEEIPHGSSVALYGGGELGKKYYQQLISNGKHEFVGCYDINHKHMQDGYNFHVDAPESMLTKGFDYVIITIKNQNKADEVRKYLLKLGIQENKIKWFEQQEVFWRFAKAEGLLKINLQKDVIDCEFYNRNGRSE